MITTICLLRGVNVGRGGSRTMKMDELRAMLLDLGFIEPRTLIQSGNAVFQSKTPPDAARIEAAIRERFGFDSPVILRTVEEMEQTIAGNPFPERAVSDASKLTVTFLSRVPEARLDGFDTAGEDLVLRGRDLYAYFHHGQGQTKLRFAALAKLLGEAGTARNWNTILKLAAMGRSHR